MDAPAAAVLRPVLLSHVNSVVRDITAAEQKLLRLLGARPFFRHYSVEEDRDATLLMVGDVCLELFCPRGTESALGRFLSRQGEGLHSFEWQVPDVARAAAALQEEGIRLPTNVPDVFFMTHPKDTFGIVLEICGVDMPDDPRLLPEWRPDPGPAGVTGLDALTAAVPDVAAAVAWFQRTAAAQVVYDDSGRSGGAVGLDVGVHLLELVQTPPGVRGGLLSVDLTVADLAAAREHLRSVGARVRSSGAAALELELEPADAFGVTYRFSEQRRQRRSPHG